MRFLILPVMAIITFSNSALTQGENPFAEVLRRPTVIEVLDADDVQTKLLKQCFNAAHNEMRLRYNYWQQGIGDIDCFLQSIERLHKMRLEVSPDLGEIACVQQKLAFIEDIESQVAKGNSNAEYEAVREINEASVTAFRVRTELEIAKLKYVAPSAPEK